MGEVFKDREALRELFELAEADEHKEDIDYSLKRLFESNENPMTRQRSAIVNAFYSNAANHRTSGEDLDPQELIDFINNHDISMLAPYLVGYFHPDSIEELTVSWWTEEMEDEGLAEDPDWEGETPGYRLKLGEDGNFIRFRTSGANYFISGKVLAGDDYAVDNPTVVFGSFEDGILPPDDGGISGGTIESPPAVEPRLPHEIGVDCSTEQPGDIVRWYMPNFRLTDNTRPWPHPNRITIWVNASTNQSNVPFINEKKIARGEVGINWLTDFIPNDGLIATSWEQINYNQNIVMAFKKPWWEVDEVSVVFGAKKTSSGFEPTASATISLKKKRHRTIINQAWLRCGELNGNYRVAVGNGLEDGIAIYSYAAGDKGAKVEFTLAPKIVRF